MADRFQIDSVHGGAHLEFVGSIPRGLTGYDGTTFVVRYTCAYLSAVVEVYDIRPDRWSAFFQDLADHWRGWNGVKEHQSLEHNLKLSCSSDSTGHIEMRCILRGYFGGTDWWMKDSLYLEAGQLADLTKQAKRYFVDIV
jgi:hypothetical protein